MNTNYISKFFTSAVFCGMLLLALLGISAVRINAQNPTLTVRDDNVSCADLGLIGFKTDNPQNGATYTLPNANGVMVTTNITSNDGDNKNVLNFFTTPTSNIISTVIVKGANDSNVYTYNTAVSSGGPLTTPIKNGKNPSISHIEFCYNVTAGGTTAATAMIAGRVVGENNGRFNGSVLVTILNANTLETQIAYTNRLGFYQFDNLQVGDTYIINVRSKGFTFAPQIFTLTEDSVLNMFGSTSSRGKKIL